MLSQLRTWSDDGLQAHQEDPQVTGWACRYFFRGETFQQSHSLPYEAKIHSRDCTVEGDEEIDLTADIAAFGRQPCWA